MGGTNATFENNDETKLSKSNKNIIMFPSISSLVSPNYSMQPVSSSRRLSLKLGFDLNANWTGVARYLFYVLIHLTLCVSIINVARVQDGHQDVTWYGVFVPMLVGILAALGDLISGLTKRTNAASFDERAVFIRGFVVFKLILCLASGSLAALIGMGVQVSPNENRLNHIPTINVSTATFELHWSDKNVDQTTVFIPVLGSSAASLMLGKWIGINVQPSKISKVYPNPELFYHACNSWDGNPGNISTCVATDSVVLSDPFFSFGQSKYQAIVNEFCAIPNLREEDSWIGQTCMSNPQAKCILYTYPQSALSDEMEMKTMAKVRSNISSAGSIACSDDCQYAQDGVCDDGSVGSFYDVCPFGTDCSDCGDRSWHRHLLEKSPYFPKCGYHGDLPFLPQRHFVPWLKGVRATCQNICSTEQVKTYCPNENNDEDQECGVPGQKLYRTGGIGEWCCDEVVATNGRPVVVVELSSHEATVESCFQTCLSMNYLDQDACNMLQYDHFTGKCEQLDYRERLCKYPKQVEDDGSISTGFGSHLDCSNHLVFSNGKERYTPQPKPENTYLALSQQNQWDGVEVHPRGNWTVKEENSTIYVLLSQAFVGNVPHELTVNIEAQMILAPFVCVPLLLGLLILCVCCTPINCLPDMRLTDEDVCAWDYVIFKQAPYINGTLHNFRLLLMFFAISVSLLFLVGRKIVSGPYDPTMWSIVFTPLWIIFFLVICSTIGLVKRVIVVFRNSCGNDVLISFGDSFRVSTEKGKSIIRAFLVCIFVLIPLFSSLVMLTIRLDVDESFYSATATTIPIWIGFSLNVCTFLYYVYLAIRVALCTWKFTQMEQLENEVRAELRRKSAAQVESLKDEFLKPETSSKQLIHLLHLFVFKGRDFSISHIEVKALGHAKLLLLEANGMVDEIWTPQVAKEYGAILLYLLEHQQLLGHDDDDHDEDDHRMNRKSSECLKFHDLGISNALTGYFYLLCCPKKIKSKIMHAHSSQGSAKRFARFLSEKSNIASTHQLNPEAQDEESIHVNINDSDSEPTTPQQNVIAFV